MTERHPYDVTTREVAAYFAIPEQSIYDQRCRDVEPGSLGIKVGRHLRFRWSDIDAFVERQTSGAQDAA